MRLPALAILGLVVAGCNPPPTLEQPLRNTSNSLAARIKRPDMSIPPPKMPPRGPTSPDVELNKRRSEEIRSLKVENLAVGAGPAVEAGKYLTVHYRGTFPDGYVFDTSMMPGKQPLHFLYDPAQPAVIRGWMLGLQGMRVGGKRRLTIPAELAYGAGGSKNIPPNAAVIFDIELLFVGGP